MQYQEFHLKRGKKEKRCIPIKDNNGAKLGGKTWLQIVQYYVLHQS